MNFIQRNGVNGNLPHSGSAPIHVSLTHWRVLEKSRVKFLFRVTVINSSLQYWIESVLEAVYPFDGMSGILQRPQYIAAAAQSAIKSTKVN